MEVSNLDFYIPAAFPLLYYDEETIDSFVNYLCSCEYEPTPQELSNATGISIEICQEKLPVILELNKCLLHHSYRVKRRRALLDYLDNDD